MPSGNLSIVFSITTRLHKYIKNKNNNNNLPNKTLTYQYFCFCVSKFFFCNLPKIKFSSSLKDSLSVSWINEAIKWGQCAYLIAFHYVLSLYRHLAKIHKQNFISYITWMECRDSRNLSNVWSARHKTADGAQQVAFKNYFRLQIALVVQSWALLSLSCIFILRIVSYGPVKKIT